MDSANISYNIKRKLNQTKSKANFEKVKSKFNLKTIFNHLQKRKTLEIVKYNKKAQKRINIDIGDYKDYCAAYTTIEIDIITANNKFGKIININNKEDEKYFHINYNNEEEVKRNIEGLNCNTSKISIVIDYQIDSFYRLFENCECIESINFKKFFRNNIKNMGNMFSGCLSLKEVNLSNFNTNSVTDMSKMFFECSSLKELNLNKFCFNKVTNMEKMFYKCSSLKDVDLSIFNLSSLPNMKYMLYGTPDELKKKVKPKFTIKKRTNKK